MRFENSSVGRAQNGPNGPKAPIEAEVMRTKAKRGDRLLTTTPANRSIPPKMSGIVTCLRLSPDLSESHELTTNAIPPMRYGMVSRSPIEKLLK
jgi:hypothetical protein